MDRVDPIVRDLQTRIFQGMSAQRKLEVADELLSLARELIATISGECPAFRRI